MSCKVIKPMELKESFERWHCCSGVTNEHNAKETSEIMTNRARGIPGAKGNHGKGKERENTSGMMELSRDPNTDCGSIRLI